MNKFWIGLLCGITLCFSTAAIASNAIQGVLFPSKITIHNGSQVKELSTSTGMTVISYKNQTFIPLRSFTEATGSIVNFQPATKENGNLNQIEVFGPTTLAGLNLKSKDGSVTLGNLNIDSRDSGSIKVTGGTVKINQDISGKQIVLEAIGPDGSIRGKSEFVYIDNENINPPKLGEIRLFKTLLSYAGSDATFRASVQNIENVKLNSKQDLNQSGITKPFYGMLVPPSGDVYSIAERPVLPFNFTLMNTSDASIEVDKVPLSLTVYKGNSIDSINPIVYEYKLPPLTGKLAPREQFEISIPWYLSDKNGSIQPGNYVVSLKLPKQIQYQKDGTVTKQVWDVTLQYGSDFGMNIKK
ncbi:hypothetical protein [Cohnella abietis]|uniref:Copper amine oxidase-like N-terminal domain-containing protein n=1 Tax=Cohnella abietis TaxID=2507935 RepID=A0A3T1DEA1_9BACL|nr:hypothetical protein [Cohnella abietis]BBI36354.1 hypothetical protein KCTCHS21_57530 [Cohnella abietis]